MLRIKALLVVEFICKLLTLADSSPPRPPNPLCLFWWTGHALISPGRQLAAPCPLRVTFLPMTFCNLYNPVKADFAQVSPAITSMRHRHHHDTKAATAGQWGLSAGSVVGGGRHVHHCPSPPLMSLLIFFFYAFKEVAPGATCVCLSHAVFPRSSLFMSYLLTVARRQLVWRGCSCSLFLFSLC